MCYFFSSIISKQNLSGDVFFFLFEYYISKQNLSGDVLFLFKYYISKQNLCGNVLFIFKYYISKQNLSGDVLFEQSNAKGMKLEWTVVASCCCRIYVFKPDSVFAVA